MLLLFHMITNLFFVIEFVTFITDGVPPDGTPIFIIYNIQISISVILVSLAVVILVGVVVSLTFNIVFRKRKWVRLSHRLHIDSATWCLVLQDCEVDQPKPELCIALWISAIGNFNTGDPIRKLCHCCIWLYSKTRHNAPLSKLNSLYFIINLQIGNFLSSLGYDICIAIALVKTWRVYYIFKNPSPNQKAKRRMSCSLTTY